ncbi:MAG: leucine-rich repeat domain-containing protein, partial [Ruminococcus sp.]|nr:leucine-rich repeat domain-containing protein [Ruminococcus sp.]
ITYIGSWAFGGCIKLDNVVIPESVRSLCGTFSGCTGLTNVTIPDSVIEIFSCTFLGCTNLTDVTIPSGVTFMYSGEWDAPFYGCENVVVTYKGKRYAYKNIESLYYDVPYRQMGAAGDGYKKYMIKMHGEHIDSEHMT